MRQASMLLSLKSLIGPCLFPRSWYEALASMLTLVIEQNIYDIRQFIADLGDTEKKISGMSIACGKDTLQRGNSESKKAIPSPLKSL